MLCVGKDLKKTSKLIMAILLGKDLVSDTWVIDSSKHGELLDSTSYFPHDAEREAEWGLNLIEAAQRGEDRTRVFDGWNIVFSASAKKELGSTGFKDLKGIVMLAGARKVTATLPKKAPEDVPSTIVIGSAEDSTLPTLTKWKFYTKDLISLSVLKGRLDLENDNFLVREAGTAKVGKKRKRLL